jgi:hypothetical protein
MLPNRPMMPGSSGVFSRKVARETEAAGKEFFRTPRRKNCTTTCRVTGSARYLTEPFPKL